MYEKPHCRCVRDPTDFFACPTLFNWSGVHRLSSLCGWLLFRLNRLKRQQSEHPRPAPAHRRNQSSIIGRLVGRRLMPFQEEGIVVPVECSRVC